jgi:hypothetical protein
VAQFVLKYGRPVRAEFGEMHSIRILREELN